MTNNKTFLEELEGKEYCNCGKADGEQCRLGYPKEIIEQTLFKKKKEILDEIEKEIMPRSYIFGEKAKQIIEKHL